MAEPLEPEDGPESAEAQGPVSSAAEGLDRVGGEPAGPRRSSGRHRPAEGGCGAIPASPTRSSYGAKR